MSDFEAIERAMWIGERDTGLRPATAQMAWLTEMRLSLSEDSKWRMAALEPVKRTIFGMPILLDPSMQPNEIKLVADCGCVVKLIDLG